MPKSMEGGPEFNPQEYEKIAEEAHSPETRQAFYQDYKKYLDMRKAKYELDFAGVKSEKRLRDAVKGYEKWIAAKKALLEETQKQIGEFELIIKVIQAELEKRETKDK